MIKILHIIPFINSGGVEKRRLTLAYGLGANKYEQQIVCLQGRGTLLKDIEISKVKVHVLNRRPYIWNIRALMDIFKIIKAWKPDILHGAIFEGMMIAGLAHLFFPKTKLILEETSDLSSRSRRRRPIFKTMLRFFSKRASAYVAVSKAVGDYLISHQGITQDKVKVIYNGVTSLKRLSREDSLKQRERLKISPDAFVIGTVGRLQNRHKRYEDILKAFSLLAKKYPKMFLLITGDGEDKSQLINLVQEKEEASRVIFTGTRFDLENIYSVMDVFVLASAFEAFGLVNVEAMFSELPVITTNVGGIPEVVLDQETGFLVPPYSPEIIAQKIEQLYLNPDLRRKMGHAGRKRAQKFFTSERYVRDVEALYDRVMRYGDGT